MLDVASFLDGLVGLCLEVDLAATAVETITGEQDVGLFVVKVLSMSLLLEICYEHQDTPIIEESASHGQ